MRPPTDEELAEIARYQRHLARRGVRMTQEEKLARQSEQPPKPIRSRMTSKQRRSRRAQLVARDGWGCHYCGKRGVMTIDHVIPRSKGGTNDLSNLVLACKKCNHDKADTLP